jgi:hypothetical protein
MQALTLPVVKKRVALLEAALTARQIVWRCV